jgi:hypothetical protein
MYYWIRKTYKDAYKRRYVLGGYMDSCPTHLTQRPLRKTEITPKTSKSVFPEIARRLHRSPSSIRRWPPPSKKTPWPPQIWRSPCWEYALEVTIEMIILRCIHDILWPCSAGCFLAYKPVVADLLWEKNTVPRLISRADKLSRIGGMSLLNIH